MNDKKMIIRNCPVAFNTRVVGTFCNDVEVTNGKNTHCQYITDCIMKQIVELCKEVNTKFYDSVHQRYLSPSKAKFARQILELLDVQEVE